MEFSNGIVIIIQVLITVAGWLGKRSIDRIEIDQKEILIQVKSTNGRLIAVETTLKDHDKMDTHRFDELERRLDMKYK